LGIIFERLVNKANGAVYTPRPEVDLMCRLSLVKWLEKNLENKSAYDWQLKSKNSVVPVSKIEVSFSDFEEIGGKIIWI
jgi:hypothetical protein